MLNKTLNTAQEAWDNYGNLQGDARWFADVLILIFEPVNYFQCESFISSFKAIKAKFNFYSQHSALSKAGLLVFEDASYFRIHPYVAVNALPDLLNNPAYEQLIPKIKSVFSSESRIYYQFRPVSLLRYLRQFILASRASDEKAMAGAANFLSNNRELNDILIYMLYSGKYRKVLLDLPAVVSFNLILYTVNPVLYFFQDPQKPEEFFDQMLEKEQGYAGFFSALSALFRLYEGKTDDARDKALQYPSNLASFIRAVCYMYQGNFEKAWQLYFSTITEHRRMTRKRGYFPDIHLGFFFMLLLIIHNPENKTKELELLEKHYKKAEDPDDSLILCLIYFAMGRQYEASEIIRNFNFADQYPPDILVQIVYFLTTYIVEGKLSDADKKNAQGFFNLALNRNMHLLAAELGYILDLQHSSLRNPGQPLMSKIVRQKSWEYFLSQLEAFSFGENADARNKESESRIIYLVNFRNMDVQPVIQTRTNSGWSKGKNISVRKFRSSGFDCMTPQDLKIAATLQSIDYYYDLSRMLPELTGHPLLFLMENPSVNVELVKAAPELITEKTSEGYRLRCNVQPTTAPFILRKETNTRYQFIEISKERRQLIQTIYSGDTVIPAEGAEKLTKALSRVNAMMNVVSDLSLAEEDVKLVEPDSRIRVQIIPVSGSLKTELFVKPLGTLPPYFKPGKGGKTVFGLEGNEKCATKRDFQAELNHVTQFLNLLENGFGSELEHDSVIYDDPRECLSLLEAVQASKDIAVLEWPEGERFKLRKTLSFDQLKFKLHTRGNWFELEGEIKVDENTVLSLQQLLQMKAEGNGRFVEIRENEFIAFSEDLRKRLDELTAYSVVQKKGITISRFATGIVEELGQAAESFRADKAWTELRKKVKDADKLKVEIPALLQAELRPYQEEGFRWMARLAAMDSGACLADDMGLGKTIQSLAILLHRAKGGPAMVVCPASVVNNWVSEVQKFAPVINVKLLPATNRDEFIRELEPFDLLVTTYGVMQTAIEPLKSLIWETVILDEAHAIKNMTTKTSKAAMEIKANFRLILTGTPVQNHLGELWNLFNFINPGLLGSFQHFNQKFNQSVDQNSHERQLLKKLIAPFILRRTKMSVLDELPPKTEITHKVDLSDDEMAFYEALRRQAILNIESDSDGGGAKHLRALAEITKLRLACCHISLVDKKQVIPSSKLTAFLEIAEELLDNKHRALVFSQFVGHLAVVREMLDKKGISYQYLDGSTSIPDRGKIVNKFQKGEGDLFLISLKAGGLGLNLTAADYVIHLDPWWNPAIEDQASDRAHRIGQNRPVTVYRLVAKNTIEEKIIQLHHSKRDMADSLLEGTDQASKLSADDLLNLIREI